MAQKKVTLKAGQVWMDALRGEGLQPRTFEILVVGEYIQVKILVGGHRDDGKWSGVGSIWYVLPSTFDGSRLKMEIDAPKHNGQTTPEEREFLGEAHARGEFFRWIERVRPDWRNTCSEVFISVMLGAFDAGRRSVK